MRRTVILGTLILLATPSRSQVDTPTFRSGTSLVEVSVVAQDQDRKPVTDLNREDFQVFDNGKPQEIRLFLADPATAASLEAAAPGTFSNRLATDGRGGYAVLLFDNLNVDPARTVFAHTARARQKALQALRAIPTGDRIAIYALGCRFQVFREFTSDRDSLVQRLETLAPAPDPCLNPSSEGPEHALTERYDRTRLAPEVELAAAHERQGASGIADAVAADIGDEEMKQLADHLAGIPGRKNLIWLTTAFRIKPSNLQQFMNANVALYPVDTIGSTIGLEVEKKEHAAPLLALAARTGGIAFVDRDDLDVGIRNALNDGRFSYTLGFYRPDRDKGASVHQVHVQVNRPGVTLRYRTSYTVQPAPAQSRSPVHDLVEAMNRPANATAIGITASVGRRQNKLDLSVNFEILGLELRLDAGLWKGQAELVARFVTAEGRPAGNTLAETISFNLRPSTYASMVDKGAPYHKTITIPANAVELKLLVGSLASGKIGTLTIPLSQVKIQSSQSD